jgi:hypothetical protein
MAILIPTMLPSGASVGWSQACGFWRSTAAASVCPARALIFPDVSGTHLAISGGWLSGTVGASNGTACATDPYVTIDAGTSVIIDIWKALADALWTSSVSFTVYAHRTGAAFAGKVVVRPQFGISLPAAASFGATFPSGTNCPTSALATVTFYDDGTYSIA